MARFVLQLTVCLSGAPPLRAWAEPAQHSKPATGYEYLEAGKSAAAAGRLREALDDYEQSYRLADDLHTLYRIGDLADKLGDHARAVSALQQYLALVPEDEQRPYVERRIAANEAAQSSAKQTDAPAQTLTPAAAAATVTATSAASPPPSAADAATPSDLQLGASGQTRDRPFDPLHTWWVWAGAGALVVIGVTVAAIALGSAGTRTPPPIHGNVAGAVQTLGAP